MTRHVYIEDQDEPLFWSDDPDLRRYLRPWGIVLAFGLATLILFFGWLMVVAFSVVFPLLDGVK